MVRLLRTHTGNWADWSEDNSDGKEVMVMIVIRCLIIENTMMMTKARRKYYFVTQFL